MRSILAQRLVPDCLVEHQCEGEGKRTQSFYRISPLAIAITARRLQMLEDSLATQLRDGYQCSKCARFYDALQAMSFSAGRKAGGDFGFRCEDCDEELVSISERASDRRGRLQRFRIQCHELLLLTRQLKDQPGPQFGVDDRSGRALPPRPTAPPQVVASKEAAKARAAAVGGATGSATPGPISDAAQAWFHQEVLGGEPFIRARDSSKDVASDPAALRTAVAQAHNRLQAELQERLDDARRWTSVSRRQQLDPTVMVQGHPYMLSRVRDDEDLQDAMTDEEYQRFADLERGLDRSGGNL